jgi:transcriptional regulator with XRE-family HTH domain
MRHQTDVVETFKKNLVRLRKKRGLSQRELAKRMGSSQRVVAYYEKEAANIPLTKLQEIARALEVSVLDLLDTKIDRRANITSIDVRTLRKIEQIDNLPRRARESLWQTINATLGMHAQKSQQSSRSREPQLMP